MISFAAASIVARSFSLPSCVFKLLDLVARDQEQERIADRRRVLFDLLDRVLAACHRLKRELQEAESPSTCSKLTTNGGSSGT